MSKCPKCDNEFDNKAEVRVKLTFKVIFNLSIVVAIGIALYFGFNYTKTIVYNVNAGTEVINVNSISEIPF